MPLTLPTPAENLALDEALLERAEAQTVETGDGEVLRLWESATPMVVLGRSSRVAEEVDQQACEASGASIGRRSSGGATIVTGPGCLMYAVVLDTTHRPELQAVDNAHAFVLDRLANALRESGMKVDRDGTSDLVLHSEPAADGARRKFSGNSLRVKRGWLLYHGTLLYDFDLPLIGTLLRTPPRQPDYRQGRDHEAFVANLPTDRETLCDAVRNAWPNATPTDDYPKQRVEALVRERYGRDEWNLAR
ncbi:MAG: lipoate--protein ligase family protein [Planctomycetota bacterium]